MSIILPKQIYTRWKFKEVAVNNLPCSFFFSFCCGWCINLLSVKLLAFSTWIWSEQLVDGFLCLLYCCFISFRRKMVCSIHWILLFVYIFKSMRNKEHLKWLGVSLNAQVSDSESLQPLLIGSPEFYRGK